MTGARASENGFSQARTTRRLILVGATVVPTMRTASYRRCRTRLDGTRSRKIVARGSTSHTCLLNSGRLTGRTRPREAARLSRGRFLGQSRAERGRSYTFTRRAPPCEAPTRRSFTRTRQRELVVGSQPSIATLLRRYRQKSPTCRPRTGLPGPPLRRRVAACVSSAAD